MRKPKTSLTKLPSVPRAKKVGKPSMPKLPSTDSLSKTGAKMRTIGSAKRGMSAL